MPGIAEHQGAGSASGKKRRHRKAERRRFGRGRASGFRAGLHKEAAVPALIAVAKIKPCPFQGYETQAKALDRFLFWDSFEAQTEPRCFAQLEIEDGKSRI
jgi:hypothetical protein